MGDPTLRFYWGWNTPPRWYQQIPARLREIRSGNSSKNWVTAVTDYYTWHQGILQLISRYLLSSTGPLCLGVFIFFMFIMFRNVRCVKPEQWWRCCVVINRISHPLIVLAKIVRKVHLLKIWKEFLCVMCELASSNYLGTEISPLLIQESGRHTLCFVPWHNNQEGGGSNYQGTSSPHLLTAVTW